MNIVNIFGIGGVNHEEAQFEAMYNEEVNFLTNQGGGFHSNFMRKGGNTHWNKYDGWTDNDRKWCDCIST